MSEEDVLKAKVPGADKLIEWFGYWPSFHDAEVLQLVLDRRDRSWIEIHTWRMTSEIDAQGYYVLDKHVVVTFQFHDLRELSIEGFNHQNVISGLSLTPLDWGIELVLDGCFGVEGRIAATSVEITITPGGPKP